MVVVERVSTAPAGATRSTTQALGHHHHQPSSPSRPTTAAAANAHGPWFGSTGGGGGSGGAGPSGASGPGYGDQIGGDDLPIEILHQRVAVRSGVPDPALIPRRPQRRFDMILQMLRGSGGEMQETGSRIGRIQPWLFLAELNQSTRIKMRRGAQFDQFSDDGSVASGAAGGSKRASHAGASPPRTGGGGGGSVGAAAGSGGAAATGTALGQVPAGGASMAGGAAPAPAGGVGSGGVTKRRGSKKGGAPVDKLGQLLAPIKAPADKGDQVYQRLAAR